MFEPGSILTLIPFLMGLAALLPLAVLMREPRTTEAWRKRRGRMRL